VHSILSLLSRLLSESGVLLVLLFTSVYAAGGTLGAGSRYDVEATKILILTFSVFYLTGSNREVLDKIHVRYCVRQNKMKGGTECWVMTYRHYSIFSRIIC